MALNLRTKLHQISTGWLNNRIPPAASVTLDQRRIFIVPTRSGFAWLGVALIVFLLAVNYSNSLAFALCFFMLSLFMLSILHTWRNLAGMTLISRGAGQAYARQNLEIFVEAQSGDRERVSVNIGWPEYEMIGSTFTGTRELTLRFRAGKRGWLNPGRLRVESIYPLGLCRAWSWVALEMRSLVYPSPDLSCPLPPARGDSKETFGVFSSGSEDFAGFRRYQSTDMPGHVDWKGYARSGEMNTKVFESPEGNDVILALDQAPGQNLEEKLSVLTGWCLVCERNLQPFGLLISGTRLEPSLGSAHLERCLEALALYDIGHLSRDAGDGR